MRFVRLGVLSVLSVYDILHLGKFYWEVTPHVEEDLYLRRAGRNEET